MKILFPFTLLLLGAAVNSLCGQSDRPAMIAAGPDSVASKLHYPASAKATKTEAAVQFYCEVNSNGRALHVRVIASDPRGVFWNAVDKAVRQGRFTPARVGGKTVPVMMGGTVSFVNAKGQPAIIVALSTADKQKAGSGENYIQPQLIMSYDDLERKSIVFLKTANITGGGTPNAEIGFDVNENGVVTRTRVIGENPKGLGDVLTKACAGAKFIPALSNGKKVGGQFNLPVDFRMMTYPDEVTGSHLGPRKE